MPKLHGARGLGKNYHFSFLFKSRSWHMCNYPHTMCLCWVYINAWPTMDLRYSVKKKQSRYQPVVTCNYWPVLGPYNNWNIIHLTLKSIPSEAFDEIHHVVLDGISENMASLVQSGMYCAINTNDNTSNGFYVIKFISEACTLKNNTTIDGKFISAG